MITITNNNLSLASLLLISTGPFARPAWFNSPDCINGRSAAWHSKYSHNHTHVFGPIACRATARITGSGGAERGWSDNKEVKTGKRSCLSSDKLRKQGMLYTSANIPQAHIKRDELAKPNCGDDDEQFDMGLVEKGGVNVEELKKPLGPRRVLKCWVEDWENVMDKGDVMRTKFLVKYGGLVFDDIDASPPVRMRVSSTKLKYIKRSGWHAMGEPPDYKGDGSDDEVLEPFAISEDVLIELIKTTEQPEILNVRLRYHTR